MQGRPDQIQGQLHALGGIKEDPIDTGMGGMSPLVAPYSGLLAPHPDFARPELQAFMPASQIESNQEKERIASRLNGFNPKDNMVWRAISDRFGANIKQPELLSIATVISKSTGIKLDRDAKRRKSVLIKWFEENWASIAPYLEYVVLEDSHNN
jgi:hypothetical protein